MTPIRKVSAKHYAPAEAETFPVRFRIKGQKDGPVYTGQRLVVPCKDCEKKNLGGLSGSDEFNKN